MKKHSLKNKNKLKIALVGNTGVGKDTFIKFVKKDFKKSNVKEIKLAKPFYNAQSYIYQLCNAKKSPHVQDGVLLNFLGQHMRFINPNIVKNQFLSELKQNLNECDIVICGDARPRDLSFIKKQGFLTVHITADEKLSLERRQKRGDISLANSQHWTEKTDFQDDPDYQIENNGKIKDYKIKVLNLMEKLYDTHGNRN